MAAIRPCTGTTSDWQKVIDILILKEREIGVEITEDGHYLVRQGDGINKFFDLPIIVNNARYEEILDITQGYMNIVNAFSQNMTEATENAIEATNNANTATENANLALKAIEEAVGKTLINDETPSTVTVFSSDKVLPTRKASGRTITATDCANAPFAEFKSFGRSTQGTGVSPSNPQEIT